MLTPDRLKRGMRVQYTGDPILRDICGHVVSWDAAQKEIYVDFDSDVGMAQSWIAIAREALDEIDHAANDVLPVVTPTYLYTIYDEEDLHNDDCLTHAPRLAQVEVIWQDAQWVYVVPCLRAFGQRYGIPLAEAAQMQNPRAAWEAYRDRQLARRDASLAAAVGAEARWQAATEWLDRMTEEKGTR